MPKKKKVEKQITIKEITDAFYSGESPNKIKKMMELLVKQNKVPQTEYTKNSRIDA
jgi:hypothetical protein